MDVNPTGKGHHHQIAETGKKQQLPTQAKQTQEKTSWFGRMIFGVAMAASGHVSEAHEILKSPAEVARIEELTNELAVRKELQESFKVDDSKGSVLNGLKMGLLCDQLNDKAEAKKYLEGARNELVSDEDMKLNPEEASLYRSLREKLNLRRGELELPSTKLDLPSDIKGSIQ